MNNQNTTYKRLGDYIREVDVRNSQLQCTNLLGLSIAKIFIPSIANTVGTDFRPYKIVKHNQFAYVPVTSRNGDKITVALYDGKEDCIISQAYTSFEVKDEKELLPEYLMMWFRRPEFDRYARFKSHGSAREVFDWEEMCNVMLPIPPIEEQQRIVLRYQAIQNRIENNKKTIAKLEEAAQALYRKMFVDGIDVERLPEGWKWGTIESVCKVFIGRTPPRQEEHWFSETEGIKWISIKDLSYGNIFISETEERLTKEAVERFKVPIIPANTVVLSFKMTVGRVAITTESMLSNEAIASFLIKSQNISKEYLFEFLKSCDFKKMGSTSSIVTSINSGMIKDMEIVIPPKDMMMIFSEKCNALFGFITDKEFENRKLTEILSLLMVEMG